jgi:hypothetical protein
MPGEDLDVMPAGGAEKGGESIWAAAEKGAEAHEAQLRAAGQPVPGEGVSVVAPAERAELEQGVKEAPKKAVTAAAKPAPVAGESEKQALRKQIEDLAAKAGMKVDGNRVEVAERVALREERRAMRETVARELAQERGKLAKEIEAAASSRGKSESFEKAVDAGDFDGMAKAAGFKDWRDMLNEQTKRMASPEYRRVQELERREQEREKAAKEQDERRAQEEQAQKNAQGIQAYKASMAEQLKAEGGQLERLGSDQGFVNLLYDAAAEYFRRTGVELEPAEMVDTPSPLFNNESPLDFLKSRWEALHAIFGDHPADQDEAAQAAARRGGQSTRSREPKKAPKVVSQRNAAEASAPPVFDDTPEGQKAYKAYFTNMLNQSTHTS